MFLLPTPPQFLNQAPPGAQQLTRPDFLNVPHLEHVIVLAIIDVMVVIGVRTMSSRSDGDGEHVIRDMDPDDPGNMPFLFAFDLTQAVPQSFCLNDLA